MASSSRAVQQMMRRAFPRGGIPHPLARFGFHAERFQFTPVAAPLSQSLSRHFCSAPIVSSAISSVTAASSSGERASQINIPGSKAEDAYLLQFTCNVCDTRSAKKISKHAYHKGVVIVTCGGCENRHLIADNMGWFDDNTINVETMMAEKGEAIRKSLEGVDPALLNLELEGGHEYKQHVIKGVEDLNCGQASDADDPK